MGDIPKIRFFKKNEREFNLEFIDDSLFVSDIADEINDEFTYQCNKEGELKVISSKYYERNPKNRQLAVQIHGLTCAVCGFNFEETYGTFGKGFIEVHHIIPLHLSGSETVIDPEKDLIPVCSNCHRMLHRNKGHPLSIDDLKKIIQENQNVI